MDGHITAKTLWQSKHDKLSNSNIASAKVQRSNYPKYQECKRSTYCKCKSPKVKLPKVSRVQKVDKTAILQSKGQTTQNIMSAKGRKPTIAGALDLCYFCTCNIWFSTFCTLDILGSFDLWTFALAILLFCRPFALLIFWVV